MVDLSDYANSESLVIDGGNDELSVAKPSFVYNPGPLNKLREMDIAEHDTDRQWRVEYSVESALRSTPRLRLDNWRIGFSFSAPET